MERALERLDEGSYGWCERCGNPIPVERLAAFPSATLCVYLQAAGGAALTGAVDGKRGCDRAWSRVRRRRRPVRPAGRAVLAMAIAVVAVVGSTSVTKQLVDRRTWPTGEPVQLLGGAVYLSLTRNSGAAFSLGSDYTFVFPIIALVVLGWIGWMARRLRSVPWAIALGLVLGGALGNLVDRIFRAPGPVPRARGRHVSACSTRTAQVLPGLQRRRQRPDRRRGPGASCWS